MKNFFLLIFLFVTNTAVAEISCRAQNDNSPLSQLESDVKNIECDKIKELNRCTYISRGHEDLRKKYSQGLDLIDAHYKKDDFTIRKNSYQAFSDVKAQLGAEVHYAALGSLTFEEPRKYRAKKHYGLLQQCKVGDTEEKKSCYALLAQSKQKVNLVSAYHNFLKIGDLDKNLSAYKEIFLDDYFAFADRYNCRNEQVQVRNDGRIFPVPRSKLKEWGARSTCLKSESEMRKYEAQIKEYLMGQDIYGDQSIKEKRLLCNKKIQYKALEVVAEEVPSCGASFEQFFPDNEWQLNNDKLAGDENYIDFKKCIEDAKRKGFKLVRINITSSASQLDNTYKAQEEFCSKGFLELSKARANSAKDFLNQEFSLSEKISINPFGENGNGTSGACPYTLDAKGNEVLMADYKSGGKKRAELNKAKYVKVSASFEPIRKPATSPVCYEAFVACQSLNYKCSDWSEKKWDRSWGRRQALDKLKK